MNELWEAVSPMAPEDALREIVEVAGRLLADLDSQARERFLMNLVARSQGDKVSGLVHL